MAKSLIDIAKDIKAGKQSCVELVKYYFANMDKYSHKMAILEKFEDALDRAKEIDEKIAKGEKVGRLAGVPILLKDNIMYEGKIASCASKFLENHKAQYTATAVQRLLDEDAVIIGRANMDEFAMGSSCENSAYGPGLNAFDDGKVAGGSSGGSAAAVALDMCAAALGSDTGGSIRQPASLNGVVGIKGSYGRVSRYGLIAFASSLDQIGPITHTVEDAALLMEIMSGEDINDTTCSHEPVGSYLKDIKPALDGKTIGVVAEIDKLLESCEYKANFDRLVRWIESQGAIVKTIDIKGYEISLPIYYIIAPAEATSNLGRFDGVKYTRRSPDAKVIGDVYEMSRTEGFGKEVKRRIMLGNFVLSSGYYDAYYVKAKRIQQALTREFAKAFEMVDAIIMPTTFGEAFAVNSKKDPTAMYAEDMFTIISNLVGVPAINIPYSTGKNGLPLGMQVIGKKFDEQTVFDIASYIHKNYKESK